MIVVSQRSCQDFLASRPTTQPLQLPITNYRSPTPYILTPCGFSPPHFRYSTLATLAMPPQRRKGGLEFFKRFPDPADWGLRAYLKAKHGDMTSQHILDGWKKCLILILQSIGVEFTEAQRERAAELLERYKQNVKPPTSVSDTATTTGVVTGLVRCTVPSLAGYHCRQPQLGYSLSGQVCG